MSNSTNTLNNLYYPTEPHLKKDICEPAKALVIIEKKLSSLKGKFLFPFI